MMEGFEWDLDKALTNLDKHGVSFEEAASVFADDLALEWDVESGDEDEERYVIVGSSCRHRVLLVVYTHREEKIRVISSAVAL